jgi:hypothetical protein
MDAVKAHPLQPGPRPAWVRAVNESCDPRWISLDPDALLAEAQRNTGLSDFGGDGFQQGLRTFVRAVDEEAQLHFVGRALTRGDVLNLLENRLRIADWRKRHPEIDAVRIEKPLFIMGLPRTGTSILHELLSQDPAHRVPLHWEVRYPCPPPESATFDSDSRIERAHREIRLWTEIVPEYDTMHELGGALPVECIFLTQHEFLSEQLAGTHQVPSYAAWLAQADQLPAYVFHKRMLQLLSWRCPRERWVLKAPSHLTALDALIAVYPDARIVWTHRDPLQVMGSVASILFATAWVRSDEVDGDKVLSWFDGATCAALLDAATKLRDSGVVPASQCADLHYRDLVRDPIGSLRGLYERFELPFTREAESRMRAYIAAKPKEKHGAHRYDFEATGADRAAERRRFAAYQERFGVPSET